MHEVEAGGIGRQRRRGAVEVDPRDDGVGIGDVQRREGGEPRHRRASQKGPPLLTKYGEGHEDQRHQRHHQHGDPDQLEEPPARVGRRREAGLGLEICLAAEEPGELRTDVPGKEQVQHPQRHRDVQRAEGEPESVGRRRDRLLVQRAPGPSADDPGEETKDEDVRDGHAGVEVRNGQEAREDRIRAEQQHGSDRGGARDSAAVVTADRERFRVEAGAESHGQDAAAGRARHR